MIRTRPKRNEHKIVRATLFCCVATMSFFARFFSVGGGVFAGMSAYDMLVKTRFVTEKRVVSRMGNPEYEHAVKTLYGEWGMRALDAKNMNGDSLEKVLARVK